MQLIVDSSVLIDHLRGVERATNAIRQRAERGDELWAVTPVRTEILAGARPAELTAIGSLFAQLRWLDVTKELADAAGELAELPLEATVVMADVAAAMRGAAGVRHVGRGWS